MTNKGILGSVEDSSEILQEFTKKPAKQPTKKIAKPPTKK
jgi:hypothetical protein